MSDFDLSISSTENHSNVIATSNQNGTAPEIILIPIHEYSRYVYIKVHNYGNSTSTFQLYNHTVNISEILAEALWTAFWEGLLTDDTMTKSQKRNISRGINLGTAFIQNKNIETMTRSFFINELTSYLRQELGYGAIAGFLVNFVVLVFDDAFKYYW